MQGNLRVRQDRGRRRTAIAATAGVHVAILALLLCGAPHPVANEAERPALTLFDLPRPPEPLPAPPPPIAPEPVRRESRVIRPTEGGGSPRSMRAPAAEQAAPAAATPMRFDRVDLPAPTAEISADLPLRVGTAASDGRGVGIASGRGTGGEGQGTGNGRGDGDGPGEGGRRIMLAEWIEKPPQEMIDEAFPRMARANGLSGIAVLICFVPTPGQPKSCSIAAERPRGRGFGPAALGLYRKFRIRPVMKGDDVYQARVLVPVTFTLKK